MRKQNHHAVTKILLVGSLFFMMFTLNTVPIHTQTNVSKNATPLSPTKPPW